MTSHFTCGIVKGFLVPAFLLVVGLWSAETAEAAALIGDQAQTQPGDTGVDYGFDLEVVSGERVAALQFELQLSDALRLEVLEAGPVAQDANKTVSVNELGPGRYRVIVAGLNQNEILSGRVLEGALGVSMEAPGGAHEVGIEGLVISSPTGASVVAEAQPGAVFVEREAPMPPEQCGCAGAAITDGNGGIDRGDGALILALFLVLVASRQRPRCGKRHTLPTPSM